MLHRILKASQITSDDHVVEIGCGEGFLSLLLAQNSHRFSIFEIDPHFLEMTQQRLSEYPHVQFHLGDVLSQSFLDVESPTFKVVANIPYYISAPIIKQLITHRNRIESATLMVQDEFAQKLAAKPGSSLYTSLAVYSHFYAETSYLFKVSKTCFRPVPKVDSAVISWTPRKTPLFEVNEALFFKLVRSLFWGRRKTISRCLTDSPYVSLSPSFKQDPAFAPFAPLRGETLDISQFYAVYQAVLPYFIQT